MQLDQPAIPPVAQGYPAEAFASIQDELASLPDSELVGISVDIPYAHQIALAAADKIDAFIEQLAALPDLAMDRIKKIRVYAAACQHAHLLAISPEQADPRLGVMLEEAGGMREDMLTTAELLVRFGFVSAERVAAIRAGNGYIDTANDLHQLSVLFGEVWDAVKDRVPITKEMVVRAGELAYQLHVALGVKRVGTATSTDDAQRIRQRAYTLLVRAYDECRRGILYLRAPFGDGDLIAPSIYVKQRKRVSGAEPEPPIVVEPVALEPAPVAPSPGMAELPLMD